MEETKTSKHGISVPRTGKLRVPMLDNEPAINAAAHLSADEKERAIENLVKYPPNNTWGVMNNDPKLAAVTLSWGCAIFELIGDASGIPGGPVWLICLEVARATNNEMLAANMINMSVLVGEMRDFRMQQLGMLAYPDSEVWTDEQRLTLKFTRAVLENKVTDELFEQAREAWGEQNILRRIGVIAWAQFFAYVYNACNHHFVAGTEDQGQPTPEEGMAFQQWFKDNLANTLSFFSSSKQFGK
ncbi:MAG: hypothetical protein KJP07_18930 [Desulfatitalea sp.]|nr:hypothetical protein [Desulfatitalea sp.]